MTLPVWPAGLPHRPVAWSLAEPSRAPIETAMQSGVVRARPATALLIGVVQMTLRMGFRDYHVFRAFWRDQLARGTLPFLMPVPDGVGCADYKVRLRGGTFTVALVTNSIRDVSFALDVWDLGTLTTPAALPGDPVPAGAGALQFNVPGNSGLIGAL
jgi:hypothetical protein